MALTKLTSNLIEGGTGTDWVTAIQTSNFTAAAGKGYFVNTTSQVLYVNLPVGVVGMEITIQDYAGTFATNKVILNANGSEKIQGSALEGRINTNNATAVLIYQDATKGWTSQDVELAVPITVDYLIVAGGGGGGARRGGGGGAGGALTSFTSSRDSSISPLSSLTLNSSENYNITIGGSGAGAPLGNTTVGSKGTNSILSGSGITTQTANGGGGSNSLTTTAANGMSTQNGGCGGGGWPNNACNPNYSGETITQFFGAGDSGQGFNGGIGAKAHSGGGGGGGGGGGTATAGTANVGCVNNSLGGSPKAGGAGLSSSIAGSAVSYGTGGTAQNGSTGGGTNGGDNTGNGGGGNSEDGNSSPGGNGGSGILILRYSSTKTITNPGSGLTFTTDSTTVSNTSITTFTAGTGNIQFN